LDPNIYTFSHSGEWLAFTRNSNQVDYNIEARDLETGDTNVAADSEDRESALQNLNAPFRVIDFARPSFLVFRSLFCDT